MNKLYIMSRNCDFIQNKMLIFVFFRIPERVFAFLSLFLPFRSFLPFMLIFFYYDVLYYISTRKCHFYNNQNIIMIFLSLKIIMITGGLVIVIILLLQELKLLAIIS
jgi:hypothetical protein